MSVIGFNSPVWLLLAVPMIASLWVWQMPTGLLKAMRIVIYLLILTALAGLSIRIPTRSGTVVILADRSQSMPADTTDRASEIIHTIKKEKGAEDDLVVIAFANQTATEMMADGEFQGFETAVGSDASNYAEALELALSSIRQGRPGRILVVGDGRATGLNPRSTTARARARNIAVDYRLIERPTTNDLAIDRIDAPANVSPGESYMINAWVRSGAPRDVTYRLLRGNAVIAQGRRDIPAGLTRLTFRDTAIDPGNQAYHLQIDGGDEDPIPENNTAKTIVGIEGPRPILHLAGSDASGLDDLLRAGKLEVRSTDITQMDWSLENLSRYSALLLDNAPAEHFSDANMQTVSAWVQDTGAGLMMTGGKQSYGPGGYYKSPLEEIMPVSMELRREHRKLALAIVVVLDRSGSMGATVGGGKTKMDLANLASAEVLELLSPMDDFGVIAVDSSPHVIVPLAQVQNKNKTRSQILSIDSQGGGIFVYTGLRSAVSELAKSDKGTRHIILFTDAADSEEPGQYKKLLKEAGDAGITVSVIGLGKPTDPDADFIRDVAKRGNGRIFFTQKAEELPRLFAQDTFVVARSTFIEDPTPASIQPGMLSLTSQRFALDRPVGGYNLTYLRPGATLGTVTTDEYEAPIAAWWHAGSGRTLAYTGEADGKFTGPIAGWPDLGDYLTSMARWTAGQDDTLPGGAMLTQEVRNGVAEVRLHLDPERTGNPFRTLPTTKVLRGRAGQGKMRVTDTFEWVGPDTLGYNLPLRGDETAIVTVEAGESVVSLPPVTLPYSPEFAPVTEDSGEALLQQLARATGGKQRDILGEIWGDLPKQARMIELSPYLLGAAILLLVFEVFERRSGMLSTRRLQELQRRAREAETQEDVTPAIKPKASVMAQAKQQAKSRTKGRKPIEPTVESSQPAPSPDKTTQPPAPPAPPTDSTGSLTDALNTAKDRSRGRRGK